MPYLTPPGYAECAPDTLAKIVNGCGPADDWKAKYVPHVLLGIDFTEDCNKHDFMYWLGSRLTPGTTEWLEAFNQANVWLLANMVTRCIEHHKRGLIEDIKLEALVWACHVFFLAVQEHGLPYFGKGA